MFCFLSAQLIIISFDTYYILDYYNYEKNSLQQKLVNCEKKNAEFLLGPQRISVFHDRGTLLNKIVCKSILRKKKSWMHCLQSRFTKKYWTPTILTMKRNYIIRKKLANLEKKLAECLLFQVNVKFSKYLSFIRVIKKILYVCSI